MSNLNLRIEKAVNRYCNFTDNDPECLEPKEVRLIADHANCKPKQVFQWLNYWYGDDDDGIDEE
jgi:hypothetical protein